MQRAVALGERGHVGLLQRDLLAQIDDVGRICDAAEPEQFLGSRVREAEDLLLLRFAGQTGILRRGRLQIQIAQTLHHNVLPLVQGDGVVFGAVGFEFFLRGFEVRADALRLGQQEFARLRGVASSRFTRLPEEFVGQALRETSSLLRIVVLDRHGNQPAPSHEVHRNFGREPSREIGVGVDRRFRWGRRGSGQPGRQRIRFHETKSIGEGGEEGRPELEFAEKSSGAGSGKVGVLGQLMLADNAEQHRLAGEFQLDGFERVRGVDFGRMGILFRALRDLQ